MSLNLDNARHGIEDARTAIFLETGGLNTVEQEKVLADIQTKLDEVEEMIRDYGI